MYYVNKIIGVMMSPSVFLMLVIIGCAWKWGEKSERVRGEKVRKVGFWMGLLLLWFWMSAIPGRILGLPLEREWLVNGEIPTAESFPTAGAIVCLGGGMGAATNKVHGANMSQSADRAWMAARLWKQGKAPKIICTGPGCKASTRELLLDFGVPENAMEFLEEARNTEEEARRVQGLMFDVRGSVPDFKPQTSNVKLDGSRPRVLLVTSAWHMRRAKLMFGKYATEIEIVPAPTDFEATIGFDNGFDFRELLPSANSMLANESFLREWIAYFGYKWLR